MDDCRFRAKWTSLLTVGHRPEEADGWRSPEGGREDVPTVETEGATPTKPMLARLNAALDVSGLSRGRRVLLTFVAFLLSGAVVLPCLHLVFKPDVGDYLSAGSISYTVGQS